MRHHEEEEKSLYIEKAYYCFAYEMSPLTSLLLLLEGGGG
jgi:hypothetical protein